MFIYRKEKAFSPELCKILIKEFENSNQKHPGLTASYYKDPTVDFKQSKQSTDITFNPTYLQHEIWGPLLFQATSILNKGIEDYILRYNDAFKHVGPIEIDHLFNIQRYYPGEGFFSWHNENGNPRLSNRVLVWMVYLNDITDRGETEFLHQHHFEEAKQGKLLIWPADWTHTHRGVSSPTQTKYILTGWCTYSNN